GTAWKSISDEKYKTIIETKEDIHGLDLVELLHPIKYQWNKKYIEKYGENDEVLYGFTAQNVQEVIPEMVNEDSEGDLWYSPSGFEAILTSAIQEQQSQIEQLQSENESLKERIEALELAIGQILAQG
ncbi:unnamed protein product, partial [marine sediment metagenome]